MSDINSGEAVVCAAGYCVHGPVGGAAKRLFDILFSLVAIVMTVIVVIVVAVSLKVLSPGPVFFRHERVGYGGRRFGCLKFRTMVTDAELRLEGHLVGSNDARREFELQHKLRDDPRIIPGIGRFLRRTSLDELPQFLNVLRGEMSVVGPRPVTAVEIDKYGPASKSYLRAKPGMTGLWQVSGRNDLSFSHRVLLDSVYVRKWSLLWDLLIVLRTFGVLVTRRGAC